MVEYLDGLWDVKFLIYSVVAAVKHSAKLFEATGSGVER